MSERDYHRFAHGGFNDPDGWRGGVFSSNPRTPLLADARLPACYDASSPSRCPSTTVASDADSTYSTACSTLGEGTLPVILAFEKLVDRTVLQDSVPRRLPVSPSLVGPGPGRWTYLNHP